MASVNVSEPRGAGAKVLVCLEFVIVLAIDHGGQIHKGVWGMSWRQKAMKGVEGCEKPGGAVKRALILGSLNYCSLNT